MNKTDVAAPALIAGDLGGLVLAYRRFPEDLEVHIEVTEAAQRLSQFAGTHSSVKIDDRGGFSGGAWHSPRRRPLHVLELRSMVKCQRSHIERLLDPLHKTIPVLEHAFGIAPLDIRQPGIYF